MKSRANFFSQCKRNDAKFLTLPWKQNFAVKFSREKNQNIYIEKLVKLLRA